MENYPRNVVFLKESPLLGSFAYLNRTSLFEKVREQTMPRSADRNLEHWEPYYPIWSCYWKSWTFRLNILTQKYVWSFYLAKIHYCDKKKCLIWKIIEFQGCLLETLYPQPLFPTSNSLNCVSKFKFKDKNVSKVIFFIKFLN